MNNKTKFAITKNTFKVVNNRLAIIIPTMNSGRTLYKSLESIRSQSYRDIEIVGIDGYSSHNTSKIASKFSVKVHLTTDERTRVKNFGLSKATLFFR